MLFLFLLGIYLNRSRFLSPETIRDLKKLVVNISLPAVLFLAFSGVSLQAEFLAIVGVIFTACVLVLLLGFSLRSRMAGTSPYFPTLMTGFEAGMMGYAIYGAVYGPENIYKFGIIDLGQVVFVFFVLVTVLERMEAKARPFRDTLVGFLKTPVILAILLGILANQLGVMDWMRSQPLVDSLLKTVEMLSALTTPLIALAIGYEIHLQIRDLLRPLQAVAIRMLVWVPFGLLLNTLVIDRLLHFDPSFQAAVMTMMVLPPPFVIPLFIRQEENRAAVVNTLSMATLVTLVAFSVVSVIYR